MQMTDRLGEWRRAARPPVVDLAVALGCFLLASPLTVAFAYVDHAQLSWALAALAISCVPLLARRRWPLAVVAVTVAMHLVQFAVLQLPRPTPAATAVALYTVAIRSGGAGLGAPAHSPPPRSSRGRCSGARAPTGSRSP
ncbi:hypothetical protein O1L68_21590 [Streptomyces lydicus]|nr:hypothetical protein [Streptomyces lydicus]